MGESIALCVIAAVIARTIPKQWYAFVNGRNYVIPDDVAAVFLDAASHRVILSPKARVNGTTVENVVENILKTVAIPTIEEQ